MADAAPPSSTDRSSDTHTQPEATPASSQLRDRDRRYEVGAEIARGGGGRVHTARDAMLRRSVAVKLPLDDVDSATRLVGEAVLLASLEHPSIVSVHDLVLTETGTPFYVMRLLEGETLRARIAGRPFEDRIALLPTVVAIADAVAYAHHRGVIHRDLKPGNVIVGAFGETSVIDWGLARAVDASAVGGIEGTPGYMAPEQAMGGVVDARTDVYGLGALLYHVLAGGTPPRTATTGEPAVAQRRPVASVEPRVPAELAAIVAKAMAPRPEDRYASAQELGTDLRRYQAGRLVAAHRYTLRARVFRWLRRHRATAIGAAVVAAAAAIIVAAWPQREDARAICARAGDRVVALWPAAARSRLVEQIRTTAAPGAPVIATTIGSGLDRYASDLAAARVAACEATNVRGERSAELLDRAMSCLDRRIDDLHAGIALFDRVQPGELAALVRAIAGLPALAACGDASQLREAVALPTDPAARAHLLELQRAEAGAEAEKRSARYRHALDALEQIRHDPATASYPPLAASNSYYIGSTLIALDSRPEARERLNQALDYAERGRVDLLRGKIWYELARVDEDTALAEAQRAAQRMGSIAQRLGDPMLDADHLVMLARVLSRQGHPAEAVVMQRKAVERWQATGREDIVLADMLGNLASRLADASQLDEALAMTRRELALHEKLLGPDHPTMAKGLHNLASIMYAMHHPDEALATFTRALAILEHAGLADTRDALLTDGAIGTTLTDLDRFDDARVRLGRALERTEAKLGPTHGLVADTLFNLGNNEARAGRKAAALIWFRKAAALREQTVGPTSVDTAHARWAVADTLLGLGRPAEALPILQAVLPIQLAELAPGAEEIADTQLSLARTELAVGDPARAVALAEQALLHFRDDPRPDARGTAQLVVARALDATHGDRQRIVELASAARTAPAASRKPDEVSSADTLLARYQR